MKHRLQSLEVDYSNERSARERKTSKADRINHCLEILSKTQSYRNCDADFTCYVERGGTSYPNTRFAVQSTTIDISIFHFSKSPQDRILAGPPFSYSSQPSS